ncbi:hypothetical protein EYF80_021467 [Liparis tanakae]|uniref:Uncharacterized protein n=1 Tax=Liparis tanakae TaxID=230148 RepID=A0A4Z2HTG7_9TELE|nr:hypothetical protein EYF80_021467 [Liparis tanakae]
MDRAASCRYGDASADIGAQPCCAHGEEEGGGIAAEVSRTSRSRQAVGAEPLGPMAGGSGRKPASPRVTIS